MFQENEPGQSIYIVKSGSVSLFNDQSEDSIVIKPGSFFGELSLIDERYRSVTALSLEETTLLAFFRSDFLQFIDKFPKYSTKILYNLSSVLGTRLSLVYLEYLSLKEQ